MLTRIQRLFLLLRMMIISDGFKKAEILKKKKYFSKQGDNCFWIPFKLPPEPELIILGNNVKVASDVSFITHDVIHAVFNDSSKINEKFSIFLGAIEIGDNVFIGAHTIILPNVKIGNDCIISAGSVVTHDLENGNIYGGIPAKKIGSTVSLLEKRRGLFDSRSKKSQYEDVWKVFKNKRK